MGTKKGQRRKGARRAYKIRKARRIDLWSNPPRWTRRDRYMTWVRDNLFFRKR